MDIQSSVHVYGQVWHVIDPICGAKEEGKMPPLYSGIVHYNRYGVVVQRTETIKGNSILMVPCSTSNSIPHDVNFSIMTERTTAGRVRALYPVNPRCLDRYVCTLSPTIMRKIESEIVKLLCPTIFQEHESGNLDCLDFDDRSPYEKMALRLTPGNIKEVLGDFVQDKIKFSGNVTDSIDVTTLKTAFDEWCIPKGYELLDVLEFVGYFQEQFWRDGPKSMTELLEIRKYPGMVLKGEEVEKLEEVKAPVTVPDLVNVSAKKWNRWTDDKIKEFLEYYRTFGVDDAAKVYNIEPSSARIYFSRWNDSTSVEVEEFPLQSAGMIAQNILKFSQIVSEILHEDDVYMATYQHVKLKNRIHAETFYRRVQTAVQTSLIEFLGIAKCDDKYVVPELTPDMEFFNTWKFISVIHHNGKVCYEKNGDNKGRTYIKNVREEFQVTGITTNWLAVLKKKLLKALDLTKGGLEHMSQIIQKEFCEQDGNKKEEVVE